VVLVLVTVTALASNGTDESVSYGKLLRWLVLVSTNV